MTNRYSMSRRMLLGRSTTALGVMTLPYLIPSGVLARPGEPGANDRIGLAIIGTGRRARQMYAEIAGVCRAECRLVAGADVWPEKARGYLQEFENAVLRSGDGKFIVFQDYRQLLESHDVDGVIISTPEHSRALACIRACQAGKDVYAEKPLCLTIREGRAIVNAVKKYKRVFQTGTQQRSTRRNREAAEYVRNGRIGRVHTVVCQNWVSSRPYSEFHPQVESVPEGLDWDMWCDQAPVVPFSMNVYLTYNNPGWHNISSFSGGFVLNAGSHALDCVQWALGTDDTGPVEVWAEGKAFDAKVTYRYANGVLLKLVAPCSPLGILGAKSDHRADDEASVFGAVFHGDQGTLIMHRGRFNTKPISISQEPIKDGDLHLEHSDGHVQNWIDCMRSRKRPVAHEEIGHRSCTVCHLANIARWTGRKLAWDPVQEIFPNDPEANSYLERPQRQGYEIAKDA